MVFFAASVAKMQENAAGSPDIQFPVKELGGCKSENDCKSYCDNPQNLEACISFAEEHNLMSSEEVGQAKKFVAAGGKGPGGCTSKEACENYCNDVNNISECIAFAEKSGIIPPQELEEAKKVKAALEKGAKLPGGCKNKRECDNYCGASEHMEECINFAEAAGFIPPEELANAKKALEAIKKGAKPLPCRGKDECDSYCEKPENFEACINFAETAGFMSSEESAMARKTGGKGPGDCRGKDECEAFCKNPENQETCFNFGKEHGLIPEGDLKEMEEGKQKMKEGLLNVPPEVLECLTSAFGNEFIEKLKTGTAMPSRDMGDKMRGCFEKMGPPKEMPGEVPQQGMPPREDGKRMMPPEGFIGPGGCKTPEECENYCRNNPEQCGQFSPQQNREGEMERRSPEEMRPPEGVEMRRPPEGEEMKFPEGIRPPEGIRNFEGPRPSEGMPFPEGTMPPEGIRPPEGMMPSQPQMEAQPPIQMAPPPAEVQPPIPDEAPPQSYKRPNTQFSAVEAIKLFGAAIADFYYTK